MDINRFTESMQQALGAAQTKAVRYGHQQIDMEHLLIALLEQERGLATALFTKTDVVTDSLKRRVEQELERLPKVGGPSGAPADQIYVTGRLGTDMPREGGGQDAEPGTMLDACAGTGSLPPHGFCRGQAKAA